MKTENEVIEQWLNSEEVCKILRISSRTLQNYRDKREVIIEHFILGANVESAIHNDRVGLAGV
jgi:hypothetical protein